MERTGGPGRGTSERYIQWAPDGTALAYIDLASGASNLWLQPLLEGPHRMLTNFTEGSIATFDWSRDGASLAFMRVTEVADAWSRSTSVPRSGTEATFLLLQDLRRGTLP